MKRFIFLCLLIPIWSSAQSPVDATNSFVDTSEFEDYYLESFVPFYYNGSWCLFNLDQQLPDTTFQFDAWMPTQNDVGLYVFKNDGKYGVIGSFGDTIHPFEYDSIQYLANGIARMKDGTWYLDKYKSNKDFQDDVWIESSEGLVEEVDFKRENYEYALELDSIRTYNEFDYLYKDGKVGIYYLSYLIIPVEYEAVQPLNFNELFSKQQQGILTFDGEKYRFFDLFGNDLLGTATSEFQFMHHDYLKYWDGTWKYYNFATEIAFDSHGNDVVLYNSNSYKVYSHGHEDPTFYNSSEVLSGAEDYFPLPLVGTTEVGLSESYLAYREAGKIGVMNLEGQKIIGANYDRIEELSSKHGHFKYFEGDSCGLLNRDGSRGFPAQYSNIVATQNPNRFIVLKNQKTGVVDQNGKIIVPLDYDYIQYGHDCFFLRRSNLIGLASINGKIIYEPAFDGYNTYNESSDPDFFAIVFQRNSGALILTSKTERLSEKTFHSFNYGNKVFKLYREGEIEVITLDENTKVEDRIAYENVNSFRVNKYNSNQVFFDLSSWPKSYLEENQKSGLFGLRFYQKSGLAVPSTYKYVQRNNLSSYFGENDQASSEIALTDDISVSLQNSYDQMYMSNGQVQNKGLVTAESITYHRCAQSTADALVYDKNLLGSVESYHYTSPFKREELDTIDINYGQRYDNSKPKKIVLNAKPIVCPIEEAEISLFEYYSYFGNLGALRMTKEMASKIMNPNLGIKFEGGARRIQNEREEFFNWNFLVFSPHRDFKELFFSDNLSCLITKSQEDTAQWLIRDFQWNKDSKPNETQSAFSFSNKSNSASDCLELEQKGSLRSKVNLDFPDFSFIDTDSLGMEYHAGRLIYGRTGSKILGDPNGKVYLDSIKDIKYLGESYFAVDNPEGWQVINRNGQPISNRTFTAVGNVTNGKFSARKWNHNGIYNTDGTLVLESDKSLDYITENKYRVNRSPEVWFDVDQQVYDTIQDGESYLGAEFISQRTDDGKYLIRRFGDAKSTEVNADTEPKLYNRHLILKRKKDLYVLDSNGKLTRHRKTGSPKEVGDFTTMLVRKERIILNENGEEIASTDLNSNVSSSSDGLLVSTSDTNYLILKSGATSSYPLQKKVVIDDFKEEQTPFYQNGFYGVKQNGTVLLSPKFNFLTSQGGGDFTYINDRERNLYDAELQRVNPIPYDEFYFISSDILAITINKNWFFYQFTLDGWQPLF